MNPQALLDLAPTAEHIGDDELPWVTTQQNVGIKLFTAKVSEGLWILRNTFEPGTELQTHRHTGPVYAFTLAGRWGYRESEYVNSAGSFLYEPAGSVHTLYTPEDNTETTDVFFAIWGANLNLDADGNIAYITDAGTVLDFYLAAAAEAGHPDPPVQTD